jgi:hypothetical protein
LGANAIYLAHILSFLLNDFSEYNTGKELEQTAIKQTIFAISPPRYLLRQPWFSFRVDVTEL